MPAFFLVEERATWCAELTLKLFDVKSVLLRDVFTPLPQGPFYSLIQFAVKLNDAFK